MPNVSNPTMMQGQQGGGFWDTLLKMGMGYVTGGPMGAAMAGAGALGGGGGQSVGQGYDFRQHGFNGAGGQADNTGGLPPLPQPPQQGLGTPATLPDLQQRSDNAAAQGVANPQGQAQPPPTTPLPQPPPGPAAPQGAPGASSPASGDASGGAGKPLSMHQQLGLPDKIDTATAFAMWSLLTNPPKGFGQMLGGGGGMRGA